MSAIPSRQVLPEGFDVRKVAESTPTKIVLLIQERLGDQIARLNTQQLLPVIEIHLTKANAHSLRFNWIGLAQIQFVFTRISSQ